MYLLKTAFFCSLLVTSNVAAGKDPSSDSQNNQHRAYSSGDNALELDILDALVKSGADRHVALDLWQNAVEIEVNDEIAEEARRNLWPIKLVRRIAGLVRHLTLNDRHLSINEQSIITLSISAHAFGSIQSGETIKYDVFENLTDEEKPNYGNSSSLPLVEDVVQYLEDLKALRESSPELAKELETTGAATLSLLLGSNRRLLPYLFRRLARRPELLAELPDVNLTQLKELNPLEAIRRIVIDEKGVRPEYQGLKGQARATRGLNFTSIDRVYGAAIMLPGVKNTSRWINFKITPNDALTLYHLLYDQEDRWNPEVRGQDGLMNIAIKFFRSKARIALINIKKILPPDHFNDLNWLEPVHNPVKHIMLEDRLSREQARYSGQVGAIRAVLEFDFHTFSSLTQLQGNHWRGSSAYLYGPVGQYYAIRRILIRRDGSPDIQYKGVNGFRKFTAQYFSNNIRITSQVKAALTPSEIRQLGWSKINTDVALSSRKFNSDLLPVNNEWPLAEIKLSRVESSAISEILLFFVDNGRYPMPKDFEAEENNPFRRFRDLEKAWLALKYKAIKMGFPLRLLELGVLDWSHDLKTVMQIEAVDIYIEYAITMRKEQEIDYADFKKFTNRMFSEGEYSRDGALYEFRFFDSKEDAKSYVARRTAALGVSSVICKSLFSKAPEATRPDPS